jgi:hypothetical protein
LLKGQLAGWRRVPAHNRVPDLGAPTCDRAGRFDDKNEQDTRKVFEEKKISFPEFAVLPFNYNPRMVPFRARAVSCRKRPREEASTRMRLLESHLKSILSRRGQFLVSNASTGQWISRWIYRARCRHDCPLS